MCLEALENNSGGAGGRNPGEGILHTCLQGRIHARGENELRPEGWIRSR